MKNTEIKMRYYKYDMYLCDTSNLSNVKCK